MDSNNEFFSVDFLCLQYSNSLYPTQGGWSFLILILLINYIPSLFCLILSLSGFLSPLPQKGQAFFFFNIVTLTKFFFLDR